MWTFLKSLLHLFQYCFCFVFFGCKARGILAPQPGIETVLPALEGETLMTGPPGNSLQLFSGGDFFLFVFSWAFSCSLIRTCAAVLHTYSQQPRRPRPRADGKVSGAAPSSKSWPLWARSGISPYLHMQPSSLLVIRVVGKPPYKSNLRSAYFQRQN